MNKEELQQKAEEYANSVYPFPPPEIVLNRVKAAYIAGAADAAEQSDVFTMSFCAWYCHAEDAQVYKAQGLSAYKMLELYKSRPYLRTESPESN